MISIRELAKIEKRLEEKRNKKEILEKRRLEEQKMMCKNLTDEYMKQIKKELFGYDVDEYHTLNNFVKKHYNAILNNENIIIRIDIEELGKLTSYTDFIKKNKDLSYEIYNKETVFSRYSGTGNSIEVKREVNHYDIVYEPFLNKLKDLAHSLQLKLDKIPFYRVEQRTFLPIKHKRESFLKVVFKIK